MSDFTTEDLTEAIDRAVVDMLRRGGIVQPPVDAVGLARQLYGYAIVEDDPDEDEEPRRYGDRPKPKPRGKVLQFTLGQSAASRNAIAARALGKELINPLLITLGIVPGTEHKAAHGQWIALIAPRLLLPTNWYGQSLRKTNSDIARLREQYPTVPYEFLGLRMLDYDDPCVIAIVDDGSVATRKSNFVNANKTLTEAEAACVVQVQESEEPAKVRRDGWFSRGWPIPTGPYNRILLRSVPEEL